MKNFFVILIVLLISQIGFGQDYHSVMKIYQNALETILTDKPIYKYLKQLDIKSDSLDFDPTLTHIFIDKKLQVKLEPFISTKGDNMFHYIKKEDPIYSKIKFIVEVDSYNNIEDEIDIKFHLTDYDGKVLTGKKNRIEAIYKLKIANDEMLIIDHSVKSTEEVSPSIIKELMNSIEEIIETENNSFFQYSDIQNKTDSNGLKQGIWKEELNQDGIDYFIVEYIDGVKNGMFQAYYTNENLAVNGYFKNDQLNGEHRQFYESGELKVVTHYNMGIINGERVDYWKNGNIQASQTYKNGVSNGVYKWYYENGKVRSEWEIVMGEDTGFYKYYFEDGQLRFSGQQINGKKEGEFKEFDNKGRLIEISKYQDGEKVGEH